MRNVASQFDDGLDQVLGLGPWDQDCGRYDEVQSPELLMSGDVLRRHPCRSLGKDFLVTRSFFSCKFALGMGVEVGAVHAEDEHEQNLGIQARRTHVRGFQTINRRRERLLQFHRSQGVISSGVILSGGVAVLATPESKDLYG